MECQGEQTEKRPPWELPNKEREDTDTIHERLLKLEEHLNQTLRQLESRADRLFGYAIGEAAKAPTTDERERSVLDLLTACQNMASRVQIQANRF